MPCIGELTTAERIDCEMGRGVYIFDRNWDRYQDYCGKCGQQNEKGQCRYAPTCLTEFKIKKSERIRTGMEKLRATMKPIKRYLPGQQAELF